MATRRPTDWRIVLAAAVSAACAASLFAASADDSEKMRAYRAAFILKFVKFTQWPEASFATEQDPIVVAVLGEPVAEHLRELTRSATVQGRSIQVRSMVAPGPGVGEREQEAFRAALRKSHAVYVDTAHAADARAVLEALEGADVLTIGASAKFASRGGMLGLVLDRGRYVFEANPGAIARTGVRVSSQVLDLAKIVRPKS